MKTTLTVTSRGVITLPARLRSALGIKADDQLIAETTPDGLLLRPAVTPHFGKLYGKTYGGVTLHSPRSLAEALF